MAASSTSLVLVLLSVLNGVLGLKRLSLGEEWRLKENSGRYSNLKASVPGGVYSALMANNIIGDIFYGYNDTETRWVAETNWTYSYNFNIENDIFDSAYIDLVFNGLDTFSQIFINNVQVGTTDNMFVRYIFDVKDTLRLGSNIIEVGFTSPILMTGELTPKQGYRVPPDCPPNQYRGECHVNQVRKMQASFAWDWGPAFPSMGIWKDVYLEAYNTTSLRDLVVNYQEDTNSYLITVFTYFACKKKQNIEGNLLLTLQTEVETITEIIEINTTSCNSPEVKLESQFSVSTLFIRKWWPNGYGDQKLYKFGALFQNGNGTTSKTIRVGFRQIELIQDPIQNSSGLSFYFRVNGVPIFAKGSNQIPLSILPELGQNETLIRQVLQSVFEANMNMLRVWGGGVYESDYFYSVADEFGILLWQDFMFACAMYPTYPDFLSSVKQEVAHQVKRLSYHPSIAVWAGNNENEVALMTNWYGTLTNLTQYKKDYIKLYVETVQSTLMESNTQVIYLSSSPSNGKESEEEDFLAKNPQDQLFGDVHFYNYLTNPLEVSTYPIPRFASEYGYQSWPSIEALFTASSNISDFSPSTTFMDHRQHHPLGYIEMRLLIGHQLMLNTSSSNYYKAFIFYSQILQAISIKFETEYYRSWMGRLDESGRGCTMGALFWQLNDVWVAPTWSSIDFTGKWKMLHYLAKDFFAPTIVTGYLDIERQLKIFVVSETVSLIDSSLEVSVAVKVYNWNSFSLVNSTIIDCNLEFGRSIEVTSIDTDTFLSESGCGSLSDAKTNCFFHLSLTAERETIAPNNIIIPEAIKKANILTANVEIVAVHQVDDEGIKFVLTIEAKAISLFVWLDSHEISGKFSENGFIQVAPHKCVTFLAQQKTTTAELMKVLTVTHLKDKQYI